MAGKVKGKITIKTIKMEYGYNLSTNYAFLYEVVMTGMPIVGVDRGQYTTYQYFPDVKRFMFGGKVFGMEDGASDLSYESFEKICIENSFWFIEPIAKR